MKDLPPGMLPPIGVPKEFLRRQKEEDNPSRQGSRNSSIIPRRRKKKWDDGRGPGGPISQSAIYPIRRSQSDHLSEQTSDTLTPGDRSPENVKDDDNEQKESELGKVQDDPEMHQILHRHSEEVKRDEHKSDAERHPSKTEVYDEGDDVIIENEDGDVLTTMETPKGKERRDAMKKAQKEIVEGVEHPVAGYKNLRKKLGVWRHKDDFEEQESPKAKKKRGPAMAYQFGNTVSSRNLHSPNIAKSAARLLWKTRMAKSSKPMSYPQINRPSQGRQDQYGKN